MPAPSQKQPPAPSGMQIGSIHSFLVHPGKNAVSPHEISGTAVAMSGVLFDTLKNIFDKAEEECQHNIAFAADAEGKQENDCRSLLLAYIKSSDLAHGREIAKRLQNVTTHRSRLGLMFLMKGQYKGETKLVSHVFRLTAASSPRKKKKA
jgi:hypothetical protein